MRYPLDQGIVKDNILICHWHYVPVVRVQYHTYEIGNCLHRGGWLHF